MGRGSLTGLIAEQTSNYEDNGGVVLTIVLSQYGVALQYITVETPLKNIQKKVLYCQCSTYEYVK